MQVKQIDYNKVLVLCAHYMWVPLITIIMFGRKKCVRIKNGIRK